MFPIGTSPKPNRYVGLISISDRSSNPNERSSFKNLPEIVVYSSAPDANNEPPVDSIASENSSAL